MPLRATVPLRTCRRQMAAVTLKNCLRMMVMTNLQMPNLYGTFTHGVRCGARDEVWPSDIYQEISPSIQVPASLGGPCTLTRAFTPAAQARQGESLCEQRSALAVRATRP
jgi:hypothetical protein